MIGKIPFLLLLLLLGACGSSDPATNFREGNYEQAFTAFLPLAVSGDLDAVNFLGTHYFLGAGVKRDFVRAAQYYEQAALAGHPGAQKNLGVLYLRGIGVKQNYPRAYGWLHFAHAAGNKDAKSYMDLMIDNVTPNAVPNAVRIVAEQIRSQSTAIVESSIKKG